MSDKTQETKTELHIAAADGEQRSSLVISGAVAELHNDPQKIHRLLDLLELPQGTQVKVITTASSVIVR
jgi:hypothetical protein